jgi:hypothetical protein
MAIVGIAFPALAAGKAPAKPHAPHANHAHHGAARAHPSAHHHHRGGNRSGGFHRGATYRVSVYNYGYARGYHRYGYHRRRGYGGYSQAAWMARMYQQQYLTMMKQRQAEARAFMATFDTNHNGTIEGKERGPAEHYLRERRLGKIPPLTLTSAAGRKV